MKDRYKFSATLILTKPARLWENESRFVFYNHKKRRRRIMEFVQLGVGELWSWGIFVALLVLTVGVKFYLLFGRKKKKEKELVFLGGESFLPEDFIEETFVMKSNQKILVEEQSSEGLAA